MGLLQRVLNSPIFLSLETKNITANFHYLITKKILINQEQALQFTSNKFISGKEVEYIVLKWYDTIVRV